MSVTSWYTGDVIDTKKNDVDPDPDSDDRSRRRAAAFLRPLRALRVRPLGSDVRPLSGLSANRCHGRPGRDLVPGIRSVARRCKIFLLHGGAQVRHTVRTKGGALLGYAECAGIKFHEAIGG